MTDRKTSDMEDVPAQPVQLTEAGAAPTIDEVDLVKIVLSTSDGLPVVFAVPPEFRIGHLLETVAWLTGDGPRGFRGAFTQAMEARQEQQLVVARGQLRRVD